MRNLFAILALALAVSCGAKQGINLLDKADFETTVDGKAVSLYTLKAGDLVMQVTNYGARVVSLWAPDRNGDYADVEIGYENIDRYINYTGPRIMGAVIGPVANRIANGKFSLDGKEYSLSKNSKGHTLHGGFSGIDRIAWSVKDVSKNRIVLSCELPDGQEGFPGNRTIELTYSLTKDNEFVISYKGTTDAKSVMSLTHHAFFNLDGDGEGSVLDHILTIKGKAITLVDEERIPTGEIMCVKDTPFDFNEPHAIGERINADHLQLKVGAGYDSNWVIDREDNGEILKVADLYSPKSGRGMEVLTDQIGLQFYSGNRFNGSYNNKFGKPIPHHGAVALETQSFPGAINLPSFPSVVLEPGEVYKHTCIYKFYAK